MLGTLPRVTANLDLTAISIRALRTIEDPVLASAIRQTIDDSARESATEVQLQDE
jgi:hypothetical protein